MNNSYFIGIYWGARKESIELCTNKLVATFNFLRQIDDSLSLWYKTSRPRKGELLLPIDTQDEKAVKILLQKGQNCNDIREKLEDLGYLIYLKSEKDFSKAHILSIKCGGSLNGVPNNVTLNIGKNKSYVHLTSTNVLEKIFKEITKIWQPERGLVRCNDMELLRIS